MNPQVHKILGQQIELIEKVQQLSQTEVAVGAAGVLFKAIFQSLLEMNEKIIQLESRCPPHANTHISLIQEESDPNSKVTYIPIPEPSVSDLTEEEKDWGRGRSQSDWL